MTSITPVDLASQCVVSWKIYTEMDWLDTSCKPGPAGPNILGIPVDQQSIAQTGTTPVSFMFWLDASKPDPKPARLKYSFYNGKIHGSLTSQDPTKDTGEYRVRLKPGLDTFNT